LPSSLPEIEEAPIFFAISFVQIFRTVHFSASYRDGELHCLPVLAAKLDCKSVFRIWRLPCFYEGMTNEEKNWRKLCAAVAEEKDPERLSRLVEELIDALDQVKQDLEKIEAQSDTRTKSPEDDLSE
jgi:hypothetical protein